MVYKTVLFMLIKYSLYIQCFRNTLLVLNLDHYITTLFISRLMTEIKRSQYSICIEVREISCRSILSSILKNSTNEDVKFVVSGYGLGLNYCVNGLNENRNKNGHNIYVFHIQTSTHVKGYIFCDSKFFSKTVHLSPIRYL